MIVVKTRQLIMAGGVLVAGILAASNVANALPSDANEPIRLLADKATYSERSGVTSYTGNVTITQGRSKWRRII